MRERVHELVFILSGTIPCLQTTTVLYEVYHQYLTVFNIQIRFPSPMQCTAKGFRGFHGLQRSLKPDRAFPTSHFQLLTIRLDGDGYAALREHSQYLLELTLIVTTEASG